MSFYRLNISSKSRTEFINITKEISSLINKAGVLDGICLAYIPHTTCGITINEAADPDVKSDMLKELNKIVPFNDDYRHYEGNSAAHIKTSLMGLNVSIPVNNGQLTLGTWQGIYLCEFDGPRNRNVFVKILKEK